MKVFFKLIRLILGPPMLAYEWLSRPKAMSHSAEIQQQLNKQTEGLTLYQYKTCPFCIKVRKQIYGLSLNVDKVNAKQQAHKQQLQQQGGQVKVPCLHIQKQGQSQWLYESSAIITMME